MIVYFSSDEVESYDNKLLLSKKNQPLFLVVPVVYPNNYKQNLNAVQPKNNLKPKSGPRVTCVRFASASTRGCVRIASSLCLWISEVT